MCIFYFLLWIFVQSMLIKMTLKQDQKEELEENRNKAKNIIVQGNLIFFFFFFFFFKVDFNFVVFLIFHASICPKFLTNIEPQISDYIRKYTYVQSFQRFVKGNHVWFHERNLES